MQYLPIFTDLKNQIVIIAGGGEMAVAKLKILLKTEANIHVYASKISEVIEEWAVNGLLTIHKRALTKADLQGAKLVYSTYFSQAQNEKIVNWAKAENIWVNVVDNAPLSDFISPAIVDRDPVIIAIGTEGAAPVLARKIKEKLESELSNNLGLMARVAKNFRKNVEILPFGRARREFWAEYYKNNFNSDALAQSALEKSLINHKQKQQKSGIVRIIGTGNGAADLLTLRARKAIDDADLIIYDPSINSQILDLARREAKLVEISKNTNSCLFSQKQLEKLVNEHLEKGENVIRLVHGDGVFAHKNYSVTQKFIHNIKILGFEYEFVPGISTDYDKISKQSEFSGQSTTIYKLAPTSSKPSATQKWEQDYAKSV